MTSSSIAETRRETERFERLLDASERLRMGSLTFDQLAELGRLYRAHASRLARLRARDDDPAAVRHLNALCLRAHTFLYVPPADRASLTHTLARTLPDAIARTWRVQVVAWALLAAGLLVGLALGARDERALHAFLPVSMGYGADRIDALVHSAEARADFLAPAAVPIGWNAVFGSSLFVHNTRVGLLAFAAGALGGVPTVLLQLYNGVLLGAFASIFLRDPNPLPFLAWILPHGIPEVTAISCCAAGGLVLGGAVAVPGRTRRGVALRAATEPALLLVGVALPLFAIAALAESFVRESALPVAVRLVIAAAMGAAIVAASLAARRLAHQRAVETGWLGTLIVRAHPGARGSGSGPLR